ncbi:MAG: endonuclease III [Mailhella sp.]|nr:endonuclease III [Mailhella sp.]
MYDAALFGAAVSSFCVEKVGTQVHDFPPAELAGRLASLGAAEAGKKKQHSTSETKNDAAEEGAHERAALILASLQARYPKAESALDYDNAWELLVATVLAAQCTDARVNTITPAFFAKWPDPQALTDASLEEIETVIHSAGFYHSKAKNLLGAAKKICDGFKGAVPQTLAELVTIPGVARKTANVVLWGAFGINEGLAVDTHVRRLSYRLGLTSRRDPEGIEKDLMKLFPRSEWGDVNHRMVWFGRDVCTARSPKCGACEMAAFCPKREPED